MMASWWTLDSEDINLFALEGIRINLTQVCNLTQVWGSIYSPRGVTPYENDGDAPRSEEIQYFYP